MQNNAGNKIFGAIIKELFRSRIFGTITCEKNIGDEVRIAIHKVSVPYLINNIDSQRIT